MRTFSEVAWIIGSVSDHRLRAYAVFARDHRYPKRQRLEHGGRNAISDMGPDVNRAFGKQRHELVVRQISSEKDMLTQAASLHRAFEVGAAVSGADDDQPQIGPALD